MLHQHAFRPGHSVRHDFERQCRNMPMANDNRPSRWALVRAAIFPGILLGLFAIMGYTALAILSPAVAEWVK